MPIQSRLALALLSFTLAAPALAQHTASLDGVLHQMDAASKTFKSAQASFEWDYFEKIVHDTTTQAGSIYFQRNGSSIDMGAIIVGTDPRQPRAKPSIQKVLLFKAGELQLFDPPPGVDQVTHLHAGSNQAQYEQFLTLGFGGSGADLERVWKITDLGPDTITDDGQAIKTEKLDLVGRDADTQKSVTHVTIWVDPARGISLKQIFFQAGGNYRTATYSHIKLNAAIDKSKFEIKRDKNTTDVSH